MTGDVGEHSADGLMGVREEDRIGVVLAGTVSPAGWNVPGFRAGFFEAKGLVERLVPGSRFVPRGETVSASRALCRSAGR